MSNTAYLHNAIRPPGLKAKKMEPFMRSSHYHWVLLIARVTITSLLPKYRFLPDLLYKLEIAILL